MSGEHHLDERLLEALLAGALPPARCRELRTHLAACVRCQEFLASPVAARGLDPLASELARATEPPTSSETAASLACWTRVAATLPAPRPPAWRQWLAGWPVAAPALAASAAALLLLVFGPWLGGPAPAGSGGDRPVGGADARPAGSLLPGEPGIKGLQGREGSLPRVELTFLVLGPGSSAAGRRGSRDGRYSPDRSLVFRMSSDQPAYLRLARVAPEGQVEWLFPVEPAATAPLPAGEHYLAQGGQGLAYSLAGLQGRQRFVLVGSSAPLPPPGQLAACLRLAGSRGSAQAPSTCPDRAAWDRIEITVAEDGHGR